MVLKRWMAAVLALGFVVSAAATARADDYIYKSKNKIDFIKLEKAKKDEKDGGLDHPHTFTADQIKQVLSSIHFNKKILILKDIENRDLFDEKNVEFLAPYLVEAFQKAKPEQVVTISYFTRNSHFVIQDDRLTVMRTFVKSDGLHIKFQKIYAKMLGDRTTLGSAAATSQARGLRVSLELQPGQNRVSWDPEELVFDLSQYTGGAIAAKVEPKKEKGKKEKKGKEIVAEEAVKESSVPKKTAASEPASTGDKSVKDRLKELDDLKKDEMITEKEYQAKRKELLKDL
jgi:hypothetical protein